VLYFYILWLGFGTFYFLDVFVNLARLALFAESEPIDRVSPSASAQLYQLDQAQRLQGGQGSVEAAAGESCLVGKACSVQLEAALPVADRSQMTEKPVVGGFDFFPRSRYIKVLIAV
jgi:hypothetical protein